ncbi:hypothetical protein Q1695_015244 [Nippostrongylus brasiliensis]|nr:hypothetical protein Q1695_015244 [Nippostrongylus brasiliensis]
MPQKWHPSMMRENTVVGEMFMRRSLSHDVTVRNHLQDLIFDLYRDESTDKIYIPRFFKELIDTGIRKDDPRLAELIKQVREAEHVDKGVFDQEHLFLDREAFKECAGSSIAVIGKALKKQLVIPDWPSFTTVISELHEFCKQFSEGQSVSKPFTYALVHDELGPEQLHSYVGQEPSGRLFNDISLDHNKKPHNPLINAGAIVVASLMKRKASLSDRFDFAIHQMRRFCGTGYVGFNNAVFLSERETADRNYALSYYMREHKVFPPDAHLQDTLDLYFQLCSIETNCDTLAVMAATMANGGVNPMNGERVISNRACRDTLSLMYSCGMYDWSGQFAFRVWFRPSWFAREVRCFWRYDNGDTNVMGIAIYSPPLDSLGNTYRGLKFAEALIGKFNFHNYDSLVYSDCQKMDPRKAVVEADQDNTARFMFAAKHGDISSIKRYLLMGMDVHERDYEDRTALHVAASEGNIACLKYLLSRWKESPEPKDRFGRTPLENAKFFKHTECIAILQTAAESWSIDEHQPTPQTTDASAS